MNKLMHFEIFSACPCGETPPGFEIRYSRNGRRWAVAIPGCCGEWMIEFRTHDYPIASEEFRRLAIDAWNSAPRVISD